MRIERESQADRCVCGHIRMTHILSCQVKNCECKEFDLLTWERINQLHPEHFISRDEFLKRYCK